MLYEIVNPSDPYTFEAADAAIAFGVSVVLGCGRYSMEPLEAGGTRVPMFLTDSSSKAWCLQTLGKTLNAVMAEITGRRLLEFAAALDSVCIGGPEERAELAAFLASVQPNATEFRRGAWHDERRTSVTDIGRAAWGTARSMRMAAEKAA